MVLKHNLIANYLGQGWVAIMGLAFIPFYIKYLGIESYGLIGFFALLQAWLSLLDIGMTPTLEREMARLTGLAHSAQLIRDLLRSIEVIAFAIAILIASGADKHIKNRQGESALDMANKMNSYEMINLLQSEIN
jgi:O-antigen/teichoic acid export membrane protein